MKEKISLYSALVENPNSDFYPFHMPGHKRNRKLVKESKLWKDDITPYDIDITEIDEFDNLHEASGLIREGEKLAEEIYGAKRTFFTVNGSTGSILAGIGAITERGDTVLVSRNCHRAVYNAVELYGLNPLYLAGKVDEYGVYGSIKPEDVLRTFEKAEAENVKITLTVITSPTYEGTVSDIRKISEICHGYGSLLFVDEAHGAHFGIHKEGFFPETAVRLGADIVVQSLHKTMPVYTQTSLLHICTEDNSVEERIKRQLDILETSSPSYIMMSGMEKALRLIKENGKALFSEYVGRLKAFYKEAEKLKRIKIYGLLLEEKRKRNVFRYDRGKLVISAGKNSGSPLYKTLYEDYHLVCEMKSKDYVIAMTSLFDDDEGFNRLKKALFLVDEKLDKTENVDYTSDSVPLKIRATLPAMRFIPAEAAKLVRKSGKKFISELKDALGEVSADYVYCYPPGIPIIVPGEVIDEETVSVILRNKEAGINISGGSDGNGIFVCADGKERDG